MDEIVTVLVLSFNSEATIIETLESIKAQNYSRIALYISDDCSKDNTVHVAENWLKNNKDRFTDAEIRVNEINKGTSANMNCAMKEIKTDWVKIIAADDILINSCVKDYMDYVEKEKIETMVCSYMCPFSMNSREREYYLDIDEYLYIKKFGEKTVQNQLKSILKRDILCSPTMFINRNTFLKVDGCDERIRNIDDWPLKIRFVDNGFKIYILEKFTVLYRMGDSVSRDNEHMFKQSFLAAFDELKRLICYPKIPKTDVFFYIGENISKFRYWFIVKILGNKRNSFSIICSDTLALFEFSKLKKVVIRVVMKSYKKKVMNEMLSIIENEVA